MQNPSFTLLLLRLLLWHHYAFQSHLFSSFYFHMLFIHFQFFFFNYWCMVTRHLRVGFFYFEFWLQFFGNVKSTYYLLPVIFQKNLSRVRVVQKNLIFIRAAGTRWTLMVTFIITRILGVLVAPSCIPQPPLHPLHASLQDSCHPTQRGKVTVPRSEDRV